MIGTVRNINYVYFIYQYWKVNVRFITIHLPCLAKWRGYGRKKFQRKTNIYARLLIICFISWYYGVWTLKENINIVKLKLGKCKVTTRVSYFWYLCFGGERVGVWWCGGLQWWRRVFENLEWKMTGEPNV